LQDGELVAQDQDLCRLPPHAVTAAATWSPA
jgi:hypothetical protein